MPDKDEKNELKNRELAQVSGGNFFKDVAKTVTKTVTGVPGVVVDMVTSGGGGGSNGSTGGVAVSTGDNTGGMDPLQTTSTPGPGYIQNNSNNSGAQQNTQNGNNQNGGGLNVTH